MGTYLNISFDEDVVVLVECFENKVKYVGYPNMFFSTLQLSLVILNKKKHPSMGMHKRRKFH